MPIWKLARRPVQRSFYREGTQLAAVAGSAVAGLGVSLGMALAAYGHVAFQGQNGRLPKDLHLARPCCRRDKRHVNSH